MAIINQVLYICYSHKFPKQYYGIYVTIIITVVHINVVIMAHVW